MDPNSNKNDFAFQLRQQNEVCIIHFTYNFHQGSDNNI